MAASLVGGAAVGAVFGELLKAVLDMKDKAIMFKQTLVYLRSTLVAIAPVIKEIEQHNNDLGRPKEELERLIIEMEEGTKLVCKCSKIHRLNYLAKVRYQEQLEALVDSLLRFFIIDMQAQTARDQKETLLKVTRILSAVNKLPLVNTEDTTGSSSDSATVPVDVSESESHDSAETQPAENEVGIESTELIMEYISQVTRSSSSDSDPVPVDESELETLQSMATQPAEEAARTNSADQVMEDIPSLSQKVSQGEAKAENSQATEQLMGEKSYDQLCTAEKRFFGIRLPKIKPILPKVGLNRQVKKDNFEPPSVYCASCGIHIIQNARLSSKGADKTGHSYCNLCYDERKIIVFEGCSYNFDLEDLLRDSADVLGKGSYGTSYKAILEDGTTLVVKRLKDVVIRKEEFEQQMDIVQKVSQHPNLMPLLAYYCSTDEKLLIYDYIAAGSLSVLLHGTRETGQTPLDWDSRLNISLGAARGIAHIHSSGGRDVAHGNIKSSNVLVTSNLQGRISDVGLTSLWVYPSRSRKKGYEAAEVILERKLTQKSDVYSFGVLLLEMLTGTDEDPILYCSKQSYLPIEATYPGKVLTYVDEVLDNELLKIRGLNLSAVACIMQLAMACVNRNPGRRPSMEKVVIIIENVQAGNTLPDPRWPRVDLCQTFTN